jgi:hypothetical protein
MSDISKVFEADDIFTRKDVISGLKSSLWAGLGKLINIPLASSIFAGRYHNFQYWFYDSIYIADIKSSGHRKRQGKMPRHLKNAGISQKSINLLQREQKNPN